MATNDIDALINRLGTILEGQAALTARVADAVERLAMQMAAHEQRLQECRCRQCHAFDPGTYLPMEATKCVGPATTKK